MKKLLRKKKNNTVVNTNLVDPNNTMVGLLLELTDEDLKINHLENCNIRATFRGYIVGDLQNEVFTDKFDEVINYPYFNSVSEAENALTNKEGSKYFVIGAYPLVKNGFKEILSKDELKKSLRNSMSYYTFMDGDLNYNSEYSNITGKNYLKTK